MAGLLLRRRRKMDQNFAYSAEEGERITPAQEFVRGSVQGLAGRTMTVPNLATRLNAAGLRTGYGTAYAGGRGTYRLVKTTYDALVAQGRTSEADQVAAAYTRPNGEFAYE